MKDFYDITNSCKKRRGCFITILFTDSEPRPIFSRVHRTRNDFSKILSLVDLSLDEKLAQEGPLETMAA